MGLTIEPIMKMPRYRKPVTIHRQKRRTIPLAARPLVRFADERYHGHGRAVPAVRAVQVARVVRAVPAVPAVPAVVLLTVAVQHRQFTVGECSSALSL